MDRPPPQRVESLRRVLLVADENTPKVVFAMVPAESPIPIPGDTWTKEAIKKGFAREADVNLELEMFIRMKALDAAAQAEVRRSLGLPPPKGAR